MGIFDGKTYLAKCGGISSDGLGVARIDSPNTRDDGLKVFVEDLLPSETARVRITSREKNMAQGEIKETIQLSPNRCDPICSEFRRCGGCQLQHAEYDFQLKMKQDLVRSCLIRLGKIPSEIVDKILEPIVGAADPLYYRNHVQYPVEYSHSTRSVNIGLFERKSHKIVEHEKCYLVHPAAEVIRGVAQIFFSDHSRANIARVLRQLVVRVGFFSKELMVILVVNKGIDFDATGFAQECTLALEKAGQGVRLTSIWTEERPDNTRRKTPGSIWTNIWGKPYIHEFLENRVFRISPDSFFQTNTRQAVKLYTKVKEYLRYNGALPRLLADVYCGTGSIGIFCSDVCHHLVGIESVESAVIDARANANANYIKDTEYYCGKAEDYDFGNMMPDAVIIDPPRKGCDEKLLSHLLVLAPQHIVYVSCNPATLARDLQKLTSDSNTQYDLKKICPVDMFPQTTHVETVALLSKK